MTDLKENEALKKCEDANEDKLDEVSGGRGFRPIPKKGILANNEPVGYAPWPGGSRGKNNLVTGELTGEKKIRKKEK